VTALLLAAMLGAAPPLDAAAQAHEDALVTAGFNFTHSMAIGAGARARVDFVVPPSDAEHHLSLWAEVTAGSLEARLTTAGGAVVARWAARSVDVALTRALAPGLYTLELDATHAEAGRAIFGIKGAVIGQCLAKVPRLTEHPADPAHGFSWPYLLVTPSSVKTPTLLVAPNNTGFVTDDLLLLRASGACQARSLQALAERLGVTLLVPLFPRPAAGADDNLYVHALSRAALTSQVTRLKRVDLQLLAMVDDARARLGSGTAKRALLLGFSAAASFASRFAVLHPDRVLAVAAGSPGGWPIAPVASAQGQALTYPVGIADLASLLHQPVDQDALRQVSWLYLLGDADQNDSVPYRDSFSREDELLITQRFGATPVARWAASEALYRQATLNARFKLYEGTGHVFSAPMEADVEAFFSQALRQP
jgi:dienelactone hydrolase